MATVSPTTIPNVNAPNITANASYINTLLVCSLVRPIALMTPNSQRFSLIFDVVEMSSKKKVRVRAIVPTIITNIWKSKSELLIESSKLFLSRRIVVSSLK